LSISRHVNNERLKYQAMVHTPKLESLHLVADGVPAMQPPIQPKSTAELSNSNFSPNIPSVDLKA
jgi:hypothetical protein